MNKPFKIDLTGKTAIVTGGYGHLGKAICESLRFHGAEVYILAKSKKKFIEAFQNIEKIHFLKGDISSAASIRKAYSNVVEQAGKFDILINNAFFLRGQSPTEMTGEDFSFGLDGCLTSMFECIRESLPLLKTGASIINVGSMYGMVAPDFRVYSDFPAYINPPHYGAAKAGVIQLTKYYASFLGPRGIRVNTVTPGPFPSAIVQENKEFIAQLSERTLLNRIGYPEDLAGAFVFLASEAANFITGQNIVVDGGWTAK